MKIELLVYEICDGRDVTAHGKRFVRGEIRNGMSFSDATSISHGGSY